ncbi:MAG: stage III sporulation protein AA [Bacillota bacterium]|nr:stage III sporulation protein AA [Bacillota bacterium]
MPTAIVPALPELGPYLPPRVAAALSQVEATVWSGVEEIRMRVGRPVMLGLARGEAWLARSGGICADGDAPLVFTPDDAALTLDLATRGSVYALQEQLSSGYLTLPGGHRLGMAGRAVVDGGQLRGLRHPGSFCLRLAREVKGAADRVLPFLTEGPDCRISSTLLVSPPRCGKTTVLRDAVRQLSDGIPRLRVPPQRVALIDERSELAGCWQGIPTRDVGLRTDVLDACPKALGMILALRSMSPDILATDEIGRAEDVAAIEEAANCGVAVIATAHGWDLADLRARPTTAELLARGDFARLVFLNRVPVPGSVAGVLDGRTMEPIGLPVRRAAGGTAE